MRLAHAVHALDLAGPWKPVSRQPAGTATAYAEPGRRGGSRGIIQLFVTIAAGIAALAVGFVAAPRPYYPLPPHTPMLQLRLYLATGSYDINFIASDGGSVYLYGQSYSVNSTSGVIPARIYAFDVSTGHIRWAQSMADSSFTPSIAIGAGSVYANGNNSIYALSAATGRILWVHKTADEVESVPVVLGTTVYFGDDSGEVYALNTEDGATRWIHKIAPNSEIQNSLAIADNMVYVTDQHGTLYALNEANGLIRWTASHSFSSSPVVSGDTVYIGGKQLYALDAMDGQTRWTYPTGKAGADPVVGYGTVYFGSNNGSLYAINAITGKLRWTYSMPASGGPFPDSNVGSLVLNSGAVYAGASNGAEYAIQSSNGELLWGYYNSNFSVQSQAVTVKGTVYVDSFNLLLGLHAPPP